MVAAELPVLTAEADEAIIREAGSRDVRMFYIRFVLRVRGLPVTMSPVWLEAALGNSREYLAREHIDLRSLKKYSGLGVWAKHVSKRGSNCFRKLVSKALCHRWRNFYERVVIDFKNYHASYVIVNREVF